MSSIHKFNIQRGDVVSIVGAGGKTSLMFALAKALRGIGMRVLVATTTKIHIPREGLYDHILIGGDAEKVLNFDKQGICVIGASINHRGKLTAFEPETLLRFSVAFDVTLLEADGARERLLKGWADHEPAVLPYSSKTIAVLNLSMLGKPPSPTYIHRLPLFLALCELGEHEPITHAALRKLVVKPSGIFKGAAGERILYINRANNDQTKREALEFIESFTPYEMSCFDRVIIGDTLFSSFCTYNC
ncbi:MAG: selenium cofactor biosynthesis protein YqeC [Defluviitaleaceae bacterium]|nr:selenium cofactor biosynthesis protein YqeC [Defluviitaleaceae bacterium]